MESAIKAETAQKTQIYAADLIPELKNYTHKVSILSLDCFDTLLWRKTAAPTDVFYDLQQTPAFKKCGLTAVLRIQAENKARQLAKLLHGTSEVTLRDIYLAHSKTLSDEELTELTNTELAAEKQACFAFNPVLELIRYAHSRGLKIIIVSDTYFTQVELKSLLAHCLPADVYQLIDTIFCSCEHGASKSAGIFKKVTNQLALPASSILHIGDHPIADFSAARACELHALQLRHHDDEVQELLRMQILAASFLDASLRHQRSLQSPFRAVFALKANELTTPAALLGYTAIGPILYAFAHFIRQQITLLEVQGKSPKVVFLMRDAYLPFLACNALENKNTGTCIRISRFSAFAASFKTRQDVDSYLADKIKSQRFYDICKQLLLPESAIEKILAQIEKSSDPNTTFSHIIYQERTLNYILNASQQYRARLKKHLENTIGLNEGDTLLFVDLGYTGTAQIKLAPLFKEEMNVDIIGCYLLTLPTAAIQIKRYGLLDSDTYDHKTLTMLVNYIALLEQLCTSNEHSVIDYDDAGQPIYSEVTINQTQQGKLNAIQQACVDFVSEAEQFSQQHAITFNPTTLRDAAAMNLCRLLFLPTKNEIDYLAEFQFDFNLGTNEIIPIFDLQKGLTGIKRRGWLHSAKENQSNMRTNYPAEWRAISLELALTLMAHHRFGLEISLNDLSHRREQLKVFAIHGNDISPLTLEAQPTHDGYFSLLLPVVGNSYDLAIQFGAHYQWVELESAELIQLNALHTKEEANHTQAADMHLLVDQMTDKGGGLFECLSTESLLMFSPKVVIPGDKHVLRIIFRPIVMRQARAS